MKVYLISHEGKAQWWKLSSWVDFSTSKPNGILVKSVRAFTKRKYAKEWLEEKKWNHLKIISIEL